jgi:S1-C subfamily serine protease
MSVNQQISSGCKRLLVVVICLLFTGAPNTCAQESIAALVRRMAPSVVTVTAYYRNARRSKVGSGFFIEEQQIVSNWHVVAGANKIQYRLPTDVYLLLGV